MRLAEVLCGCVSACFGGLCFSASLRARRACFGSRRRALALRVRLKTHHSETALATRGGARAAPAPRTHMLCALAPRVARVIANRVVFAAVGLGRGVLRARSPHASSARFCAPTARELSVAPLLTCAAAAGLRPSFTCADTGRGAIATHALVARHSCPFHCPARFSSQRRPAARAVLATPRVRLGSLDGMHFTRAARLYLLLLCHVCLGCHARSHARAPS